MNTYPLNLTVAHVCFLDADTLIKVDGSREKAKHLKNPLSKYVEYPGANHVLLEEKNQKQMLEDIEKWLESIIQAE